MAQIYRDVAINQMIATTEEAMSHAIDWWGDLPTSMKEAIDKFRVQLGAAIDSVEFVRKALDRPVPETSWKATEQRWGLLPDAPKRIEFIKSGVKAMSAFGTKRTWRSHSAMSAIGGKADVTRWHSNSGVFTWWCTSAEVQERLQRTR